MSKYKKGDKFIFEIEGIHESFDNFYRLKGSSYSLPEVWFNELEKFDETKDYKQGIADAWEAARKIILSYKDYSALKPSDFKEVFGTVDISEVLEKFTAAEAIDRIKEHEEKQIINVGDEIIDSNGDKCVITHIFDNWLYGISQNGRLFSTSKNNEKMKKTSRHFSQVEEMLKIMQNE